METQGSIAQSILIRKVRSHAAPSIRDLVLVCQTCTPLSRSLEACPIPSIDVSSYCPDQKRKIDTLLGIRRLNRTRSCRVSRLVRRHTFLPSLIH